MHDACEYGPEVHERAVRLARDTTPWVQSAAFAVEPLEHSLSALFGTESPIEWDAAAGALPLTSLPAAMHVAYESLMLALRGLFATVAESNEAAGVFRHWISALAAMHVGEEPW